MSVCLPENPGHVLYITVQAKAKFFIYEDMVSHHYEITKADHLDDVKIKIGFF